LLIKTKENKKDLEKAQAKGLSPALLDRLTLTEARIDAMAEGVEDIIKLEDPVGQILEETGRPNGLKIQKVSVPIGVFGMIYESRPNVTIDAAALCLKSHNTVLLRGGSESFYSSSALHSIVQESLEKHDIPVEAVSMVPSTDRALVGDMLKAHDVIDVMVPRGGRGLIERVMREATMPVFAHLDGNCHIFVDQDAEPEMAASVILNAKLRRTGVCGAVESLLFHQNLERKTTYRIVTELLENGCEILGDSRVQELDERVGVAQDSDWSTEYLEAKISCKYVEDVEEAIAHINHYGSHHTDSILTSNPEVALQFQKEVDSAIVMHNTSTQFADGGEFGMGAEIGIGTGKLHARGPVGLKQLVTFKYLVHGDGQTRP